MFHSLTASPILPRRTYGCVLYRVRCLQQFGFCFLYWKFSFPSSRGTSSSPSSISQRETSHERRIICHSEVMVTYFHLQHEWWPDQNVMSHSLFGKCIQYLNMFFSLRRKKKEICVTKHALKQVILFWDCSKFQITDILIWDPKIQGSAYKKKHSYIITFWFFHKKINVFPKVSAVVLARKSSRNVFGMLLDCFWEVSQPQNHLFSYKKCEFRNFVISGHSILSIFIRFKRNFEKS